MYDPEETPQESEVVEFIEERADALEEAGWSQEEISEALGDRWEDYSPY